MEPDPNRKFYRWQFQSKKVPMIYQTTGVPIKVYRRFLFFDFYVGKGIVKDISIGGLGFIMKRRLSEHFVIELPTGLRIPCCEKHHFDIGNGLNFYGASWNTTELDEVLAILKLYSKKAYRGDEQTDNPTATLL